VDTLCFRLVCSGVCPRFFCPVSSVFLSLQENWMDFTGGVVNWAHHLTSSVVSRCNGVRHSEAVVYNRPMCWRCQSQTGVSFRNAIFLLMEKNFWWLILLFVGEKAILYVLFCRMVMVLGTQPHSNMVMHCSMFLSCSLCCHLSEGWGIRDHFCLMDLMPPADPMTCFCMLAIGGLITSCIMSILLSLLACKRPHRPQA